MGPRDGLLGEIREFALEGGGLELGVASFIGSGTPEPVAEAGPPRLVVRCLRKVYGLPGPVRRALRARQVFARKVQERGGTAFDPRDGRDLLMPVLLLTVGAVLVATRFQGILWPLFFLEFDRSDGADGQ